MQKKCGGLAAALLCVVLFLTAGCSRRQEVYLSGLESELAAKQSETESAQEIQRADSGEEDAKGLDRQTETETQAGPDGYIHICGAVKNPGVYPITEGMRVFEALELAGGLTEEADSGWLNQAQCVSDGQQLYVYTKEETAQFAAEGVTAGAVSGADSSDTAQSGAQEQKVNINTADRDTLMTLPGIGEAKAEAIIQYRSTQGAFGAIEEIQNISGIKDAVFSKIKDRITV